MSSKQRHYNLLWSNVAIMLLFGVGDPFTALASTRLVTINRGDTLSGIAKTLFGNARYWTQIWEQNHDSISNPNLIYPGRSIRLGVNTQLPSLEISQTDSIITVSAAERSAPTSDDWRNLPPQRWENIKLQLPPEVDPLGFDRRSRITFHQSNGFEIPVIVTTKKIPILGNIESSNTGAYYFGTSDTVFIKAETDLQVGQTYALTEKPRDLSPDGSDREGYVYVVLGHVKILDIRDGNYIGLITEAKDFIKRETLLMPSPEHVPDLTPIPGPDGVLGKMGINPNLYSGATAQHQFTFVDRGADDGIKLGMVFRVFVHDDPATRDRISKSQFITQGDMMVVQLSEKFSTCLVINSLDAIPDNLDAVLLTDVTDLRKGHGFSDKVVQPAQTNQPLEDLEKSGADSLGAGDKKELKQLEKWKSNPKDKNTATPAADSSSATEPSTSPTDSTAPSAPPPPPPDTAAPDTSSPPTGTDAAPKDSSASSNPVQAFPQGNDAPPPPPPPPPPSP